jgi:bacillithiol biosynthesis deacetylase BshB2
MGMTRKPERHILVVLPHPDDEAFGCSGFLAQNTKAGIPVTYACGTLGQMGRNMGNPFFATRESLPVIRDQELSDACAALGITDIRRLGMRDKTIEFLDPEKEADRIEAIIREVNPSLVITHYPGHGVHPDHDALGAITVRAVARLPKAERPTVYAMAITRNREEALGPADVSIDVTDVADIKRAAIRAHRSQTEAMFRDAENKPADPAYQTQLIRRMGNELYWTYRFGDDA